MLYSFIDSPIGPLLLTGDGESLQGLHFSTGKKARGADPRWRRSDDTFRDVRLQIREYFGGERKTFDVPLAPQGTDFQISVWQALAKIPYGETCAYADIAKGIGNPKAVRAVGSANGNNPIAIIVPCHRVIGSDGNLTGFGGGLDSKRYLLELEARNSGLWS